MSHRRCGRAIGALFASAVLGAAVAAPAVAAPYEQINRASGAFGGSPLFGVTARPTALGDVGRYAGWEDVQQNSPGGLLDTAGYVRDIQSNTTYTYGGGVRRVFSIDRAERRVLLLRTRSGKQQIVAQPIAGGAPLLVAEFPEAARMPAAALSGDGRKVVVSQETVGTRVFDLTGGVVRLQRVVSPRFLDQLGPRAVSDDASVITGFDPNVAEQVLFARGTTRVIDAVRPAVVDPRGTSVAWTSPRGVTVRTLAAGTERSWPLPGGVSAESGYGALWVADGGVQVVVGAPSYLDPAPWRSAQVLTTAPGTWAPFAGRFGSSLPADLSPAPISASGRLALTTGRRAVVLTNLTNGHLVGANEGLAPAAYVEGGSSVSVCSEPATLFFALQQPLPFVPAPAKAVLTATVGATTVASGTITNALPYGSFQLPEDPTGWVVTGEYDARGPEIKLTATVTDGAGRVLTESWTEPDPFCGG